MDPIRQCQSKLFPSTLTNQAVVVSVGRWQTQQHCYLENKEGNPQCDNALTHGAGRDCHLASFDAADTGLKLVMSYKKIHIHKLS